MSNSANAEIALSGDEVRVPGVSEEMYKAVIGPNNQEEYLRHFARFDEKGRIGASWHWPAFFVTFAWLIYRKMWGFAAIYLFLLYVVTPQLMDFAHMVGGASEIVLTLAVLFGAIFLFPMYAHALYYMHCRKKIADSAASTDDAQVRLDVLSKRGGTVHGSIAVGMLYALVVLAASGLLIGPVCGC